ncbi:MAG: hypothetical protein DLM58_13575 [Pseudonocardiales bacterium]|nr:MAG: hypothetical protein DLM58_13575 [Pseudonocardiales bacterium]
MRPPRQAWLGRSCVDSSASWRRESESRPQSVSGHHRSFVEREDIAVLRARGVGVREVARRLGRDPAAISRELRPNADLPIGLRGVDPPVVESYGPLWP